MATIRSRASKFAAFVIQTSANSSSLVLGNTTVNAVINSTALSIAGINANMSMIVLGNTSYTVGIPGGLTANGSVGTVGQVLSSNGTSVYWGAPPSTANSSTNFQINSLGAGTAGSGTTGEIRATNNITAYYSSDEIFKENIKDVANALAIVAAIGSKQFDWTDSYVQQHGGADGYFIQKHDFGVIAQDVQKVFPSAVRTRSDGTLAVDYEKLGTLSFGAIQELLARVEALEQKLK